MNSGAQFSEDRKFRYALWRRWDRALPMIMFIGLNPSTADEDTDDATIRSITRICKHNGYGGFYMMNCFPSISTDPKLIQRNEQSEVFNNNLIEMYSKSCDHVIFAWGSFDIVKESGRDKELIKMFPNAKALFVNKNGSPKHPLYCKSNTTFVQYKPTNE